MERLTRLTAVSEEAGRTDALPCDVMALAAVQTVRTPQPAVGAVAARGTACKRGMSCHGGWLQAGKWSSKCARVGKKT